MFYMICIVTTMHFFHEQEAVPLECNLVSSLCKYLLASKFKYYICYCYWYSLTQLETFLLFCSDFEHGLHDGVHVKVRSHLDTCFEVSSTCTPLPHPTNPRSFPSSLSHLQLLQHQVSGPVPGNHCAGVSVCHHLQLPEQSKSSRVSPHCTRCNTPDTPEVNSHPACPLAGGRHVLPGRPVLSVHGHAALLHHPVHRRPLRIRKSLLGGVWNSCD